MILDKAFWTPVAIYRVACCAAVVVLFVDGLVIDASHAFPNYIYTWRWSVAIGLPLFFVFMTFVSAKVRQHASDLMVLVCVMVMIYASLVAYETNLGVDAAFGSIVLLCGSSVIFERLKHTLTNAIAGTSVMLGICYMIPEPELSFAKYAITLLGFMSFILILTVINIQLRAATKKSEDAANAWFDHAADALIYGDVSNGFKVEKMNQSAGELFATDQAQAAVEMILEGVLEKDTDSTRESVQALASTTDALDGKYKFRRSDGSRFWGALSLRRLILADEETTLVRITNITDQVQHEEQLTQAKLEAEAAMQARTRFLANMSHEIRTPMNGVIGMTSLVLESELDPQQRNFMETIRTSGESLLKIINEILDFSKIDADKVHLESITFALEDCVAQSLQVVSTHAHTKGLELVLDMDPNLPSNYLGDANRIKQVLVNLLSNAVKFTDHGYVVVRIEKAAQHEQQICFVVEDSGTGIAADKLDHLFEPFTQADASTTRRHGGTGLGLTISKRLAQLMGGDIIVESNLGEGTRFIFTLPAPEQTSNIQPELQPTIHTTQSESPQVLLLETGQTRIAVTHMLSELGAKVDSYDDESQALDALAKNDYDQILVGDRRGNQETQALISRLNPGGEQALVVLTRDHAKELDNVSKTVMKPVLPGTLRALLAPSAGMSHQSEQAMPEIPNLALGSRTFLLAEDNPVNQKVALFMLKKLGIKADIANNGQEAIEMQNERQYDYILMDVQMPEMDGLEASRIIRQSSASQPCIIAMTANAMQQDREECLAAGMDEFIAKPVRLEDLHSVLAAVQQ
jgi:PAS domain S-box-containing protein